MNEENPSTDATFDRLLDELHGIQSGQSYAAANPGIPSIRPHTGYATDGPYPPRRRNDGQSRNRTPVRHDHGCPPRPHDTHVAARQGPSRHPHMGAVHP